jgi:hypothetical protein
VIFYYALGGGLGHITRAQVVAHALGLQGPITLAYSPSREATSIPLGAGFRPRPAPVQCGGDMQALRAWLETEVAAAPYHTVFIDAFPGGLLGELCDFPFPVGARRIHLARLLNWRAYASALNGALPRFSTSYMLESLTSEHLAALAGCSDRCLGLELPAPSVTDSGPPRLSTEAPLWLIVHAGSDAEILELVALAQETATMEGAAPRFLLLSPIRPAALAADVLHRNPYPAWPWFEQADRIFSGCGFNTLRELRPHAHKHTFLPFPRRFDDQFERARRLRVNGAIGKITTTPPT